jgi:hypothetical protein
LPLRREHTLQSEEEFFGRGSYVRVGRWRSGAAIRANPLQGGGAKP